MEITGNSKNHLLRDAVWTAAWLVILAAVTGLIAAFVFLCLFWFKYNIIYSLLDGAVTLAYLTCTFYLLHSVIMLAAGMPVFVVLRIFRLGGRTSLHFFPQLFGITTVIGYYIVLPQLVPVLKSKFQDISALDVSLISSIVIVGVIFAVGLILARKLANIWANSYAVPWKRAIWITVLAVVVAVMINMIFPDTHRFETHYRDVSRQTTTANKPAQVTLSPKMPARNIILVTYDALRPDHLSYFDYARRTSPFVDELMSQSAAFSNVTATYPQTSQSFASLLTSSYPWFHGVWSSRTSLPDRVVTLAEELADYGYTTCAVVSNINLYPVFNFQQGFERYQTLEKTDPTTVTNEAIAMAEHGLEDPFFLWVHYLDPHTPYKPPDEFAEHYRNDARYQADRDPAHYRENHFGKTPTADQVADALACYDGEIRYQDEQFRRLFEYLESAGHLDNTLLIFTSDHGEYMGHHGYYFNHGPSPYRELQVPLSFYLPGVINPRRIDEPVELIDIAPTLFSLVGINATRMMLAGVDLSSYLTSNNDGAEFPRAYALGTAYVTDEQGLPQFFILRSRNWELIVNKLDHIKRIDSFRSLIEFSFYVYKFKGQGIELYHASDSVERRNAAADNPEIVESMLYELGEALSVHTLVKGDAQEQGSISDLDEDALKKLKALGYIN